MASALCVGKVGSKSYSRFSSLKTLNTDYLANHEMPTSLVLVLSLFLCLINLIFQLERMSEFDVKTPGRGCFAVVAPAPFFVLGPFPGWMLCLADVLVRSGSVKWVFLPPRCV